MRAILYFGGEIYIFLKKVKSLEYTLNCLKKRSDDLKSSHFKLRRHIDGKTVVTVTDFIFLGSKITADGDCSHETKRHLLLGVTAVMKLKDAYSLEGKL